MLIFHSSCFDSPSLSFQPKLRSYKSWISVPQQNSLTGALIPLSLQEHVLGNTSIVLDCLGFLMCPCKICALNQQGMEGFKELKIQVSPLRRASGQGNEKQTPTSSRKGVVVRDTYRWRRWTGSRFEWWQKRTSLQSFRPVAKHAEKESAGTRWVSGGTSSPIRRFLSEPCLASMWDSSVSYQNWNILQLASFYKKLWFFFFNESQPTADCTLPSLKWLRLWIAPAWKYLSALAAKLFPLCTEQNQTRDLQDFCIKVNKNDLNWHSTRSLVSQSQGRSAVLKLQSLNYQSCLRDQEIKAHVSRQREQQLSLFRWPVQGTLLQFGDALTFSHGYSFTSALCWMDFLQLKKVDVHLKKCRFISVTNTLYLSVYKNTDEGKKKNQVF